MTSKPFNASKGYEQWSSSYPNVLLVVYVMVTLNGHANYQLIGVLFVVPKFKLIFLSWLKE